MLGLKTAAVFVYFPDENSPKTPPESLLLPTLSVDFNFEFLPGFLAATCSLAAPD